jgi:ribosomal protein L37AE/L43A
MWRNPFFAGIQTNAFMDGKPIKGKWEPMVSEETFWKVQEILNDNHHQGYKVQKSVSERPLIGILYCSHCGSKLTGYEVKKKGKHYYKCQKCKGMTINAVTSSRQKRKKGAHDLFVELLNSYVFSREYIKAFELQLKRIMNFNSNEDVEHKKI